jgi:hypothetical protein
LIKQHKKALGRIPIPRKPGYAILPKKGKGSYRRIRKNWKDEDEKS